MNVCKGLKEVALSPKYIINNAILLFKSKKKVSILVEGKKDKILLKSIFNERNIDFPICEGKGKVIDSFYYLQNKIKESEHDGIYFLVDVDFDFILERYIKHDKVIYSFLCNHLDELYFNDLENFIVHGVESNSLYKIIINSDPIYEVDVNLLKEKLLKFSKRIGSYRAADEKLKSSKSILDGVDLFDFVTFVNEPEWDMIFNENALKERLEISSPRKLDVDDLFYEAKSLFDKHTCLELSHGHDLSRLIKYFLIENTKGFLIKRNWKNADDVEMMLRIGIDKNCFLESNVGKKITNILSQF